MNPLQQLFSSPKAKQQVVETEADKIMFYVKSLVNREDLIEELIKRYKDARALPLNKQEASYIPLYIGFEAFITRNKPLIVKREFTKTSLRDTIKQQFNVSALSPTFRLLFLTSGAQNALLFEQGAQPLAQYIINNIGLPHLKTAVSTLHQEEGKVFFAVNEQGLNFDSLEVSLQSISDTEVKEVFRKLFKALLFEITNSLGKNFTDTVIQSIFDGIKKLYDYDIISQFLDILPENVLENEKVSRLGRDELELKIQSRTGELDETRRQLEQKLELIKKQNMELSQAKQALSQSLQDEKRLEEELKKEKEQVEEKVKERTEELNKALANLQASYKQTENEKARLLASINSLSMGFVMTDSSDSIIASNQSSYQMLRATEGQFKSIQELADHVKESVNLKEYYQRCKNERELQKTKDVTFGNSFLRFFFTPVLINTDCIGVVILVEDISEAKLLERSKDEFFAIASHELRTPLTAIRGYTSLILDNFQKTLEQEPKMTSMLSNIHASSIRLIKIVNSFLDASKLEQGKASFNLQNFALIPLAEGVVTDLSQLAKDRNIYLKLNQQELPEVYADQDKVKQVLYNLIGNAIKFTETGGITITVEKSGNYVKASIADTGLGVSEEYRQLLFRKFQQAGERILTRDAATGSGMGLYISKLLIEAMKGTIKIENTKLGEGSTFTFTLPAAGTL
jgi:signal transduction histidine kinase